jgi:uncharacterized protein YbaP (TraB family)
MQRIFNKVNIYEVKSLAKRERSGQGSSSDEPSEIYNTMLKLEEQWLTSQLNATSNFKEAEALYLEHDANRSMILKRQSLHNPVIKESLVSLIVDVILNAIKKSARAIKKKGV